MSGRALTFLQEARGMVADRPSRRLGALPYVVTEAPNCPRCDAQAVGNGGRWWCAECSAPVSAPRQ